MNEKGEVVGVAGDIARVKFNRTSACKHCGACGLTAGDKEITVTVDNTLNAKRGDYVLVEIKTGSALKATAKAYMFPLIMLIAGVALGYIVGGGGRYDNPDMLAAVLGLAFSIFSFVVLRLTDKNRRQSNPFKMIKIIKGEDTYE